MIYIFVILLLLVLIYHYDVQGNKVNRNFNYKLLFVILTMIAGMRYRIGADTTSYLYAFYHDIPPLWKLTKDDLTWDSEPLWTLLNSFVRSIGGRWYVVQFIQATFVNYLSFHYFKKHSEYIFSCIFFYFIWMYIYYVMEEMRASMSIVLCLYANDYFLEKKWGKGYLLILIGCLLHKSTILLIIVPLLLLLMQSNFVALITILVAFIITFILKSQLNDFAALIEISDSIDDKIESYLSSEKYGAIYGNFNFFLVHVFPYLFYPLLSLYYNKKGNKNMVYLKPLLFIGLIFAVIRFNVDIVYRYVHFYLAYIIIFISQLFVDMQKQRKKISIDFAYIRTWILFFLLFILIGKAYNKLLYYPYSSIIERSISHEREKAIASGTVNYRSPYYDEY